MANSVNNNLGDDRTELSRLVDSAGVLSGTARSVVETVLDYAEMGDRQAVKLYVESLSKADQACLVRDLMVILPIARSVLMEH